MTVELTDAGQIETLLRERVAQLESLSRLSEVVARAARVEDTYDAALDCVAETLSPDRASVLLFDDDGVIRFKAWRGLSDAYRRAAEGHSPWSPETTDPEPVLVADVVHEPALAALRPVVEAEGIRSLGFFPLVAGGRLLGKFMVYFDRPHAFTDAETRLAQAIGAHIAVEIARRRAEDELRLHAALLEAQSELATECILVVSPAGRIVSFNPAFAELWRLDAGFAPGRDDEEVRAAMRPLLVDPDRFFGDLADVGGRPAEERHDELVLADGRVIDRRSSPIGEAGGAALGRVWFFRDITAQRRSEQRAALLDDVGAILGSSLDYRATLRRLAELAVTLVADVCAVDLIEGGRLQRVAFASSHAREPGEAGDAQTVVETGEPALADGGSTMIVPLQARGRRFGAITFRAGEGGRRYGRADVEFAADLAARAALAADNGLVHEAEQRARDAAERLQAVTEALARVLSTTEIAETIVREGAAALGAAAGWIAAVDEDASMLRRLASLGYLPELEAAYSGLPLDLVNPTVDAVHGERAFWFESADQVAAAYPSLADDYRVTGFEAMAIVPLAVGGRATGVIALNFSQTRSFRAEEQRLLVALAAQCGQALERAALYTELHERADAASVLAHVGDGVFQLDLADRITLWNRGAEVITDISAIEAVGRHISEVFPGWDAIRDRISITDVPLAFGRREALPLQLAARELLVAISGVATGEGIVYAFRDVTESEKLEKARRDFLATASHELRTPLAGVFGATKTLLHRDLDEQTKRALLQVIDSESERLAGILDDILFASQLDADTIQLSIGRCDIPSLASDVIELQRARVPDGLTLRLEVPTDPPAARCDPEKVRQVIVNLIDNAIKYSPAGGEVTVSITADDDVVRLAVTDSGLGIAGSEHERVFEKFYRLDPELSRGVGGTGLGLYISRQFVERMDGRIWLESREGEGSTFYVELPRAA